MDYGVTMEPHQVLCWDLGTQARYGAPGELQVEISKYIG